MSGFDPDHVRRAYDEVSVDHASGSQMLADVHRTVRRRRRNRTVALGAGVAATVVVGVATAAAWTGADPRPDVVADSPTAVTLTTPDGDTVELSEFTVRCDEVAGGDEAPTEMLVVESTGAGDDGAVLRFQGEATALADAGSMTFPVDENADGAPRYLELFAAVEADAEVLEATTTAEASSGTIEVREAGCGDEPRLDADVDLTLGTESSSAEGPVRVSGSVSAP